MKFLFNSSFLLLTLFNLGVNSYVLDSTSNESDTINTKLKEYSTKCKLNNGKVLYYAYDNENSEVIDYVCVKANLIVNTSFDNISNCSKNEFFSSSLCFNDKKSGKVVVDKSFSVKLDSDKKIEEFISKCKENDGDEYFYNYENENNYNVNFVCIKDNELIIQEGNINKINIYYDKMYEKFMHNSSHEYYINKNLKENSTPSTTATETSTISTKIIATDSSEIPSSSQGFNDINEYNDYFRNREINSKSMECLKMNGDILYYGFNNITSYINSICLKYNNDQYEIIYIDDDKYNDVKISCHIGDIRDFNSLKPCLEGNSVIKAELIEKYNSINTSEIDNFYSVLIEARKSRDIEYDKYYKECREIGGDTFLFGYDNNTSDTIDSACMRENEVIKANGELLCNNAENQNCYTKSINKKISIKNPVTVEPAATATTISIENVITTAAANATVTPVEISTSTPTTPENIPSSPSPNDNNSPQKTSNPTELLENLREEKLNSSIDECKKMNGDIIYYGYETKSVYINSICVKIINDDYEIIYTNDNELNGYKISCHIGDVKNLTTINQCLTGYDIIKSVKIEKDETTNSPGADVTQSLMIEAKKSRDMEYEKYYEECRGLGGDIFLYGFDDNTSNSIISACMKNNEVIKENGEFFCKNIVNQYPIKYCVTKKNHKAIHIDNSVVQNTPSRIPTIVATTTASPETITRYVTRVSSISIPSTKTVLSI
eukprot:jgi/Orpsp1_1/1176756/evm.model.c7180000058879.1